MSFGEGRVNDRLRRFHKKWERRSDQCRPARERGRGDNLNFFLIFFLLLVVALLRSGSRGERKSKSSLFLCSPLFFLFHCRKQLFAAPLSSLANYSFRFSFRSVSRPHPTRARARCGSNRKKSKQTQEESKQPHSFAVARRRRHRFSTAAGSAGPSSSLRSSCVALLLLLLLLCLIEPSFDQAQAR